MGTGKKFNAKMNAGNARYSACGLLPGCNKLHTYSLFVYAETRHNCETILCCCCYHHFSLLLYNHQYVLCLTVSAPLGAELPDCSSVLVSHLRLPFSIVINLAFSVFDQVKDPWSFLNLL